MIVGTIFAIKKSWFTEVGEFDSEMKQWGGENIDLPIKVSTRDEMYPVSVGLL